ncbi:MAG: hypothetical protein ACR2N6_06615 [Miltoncostaeaceae bacterium]
MRRGGPPGLRLDVGAVPAFARVARGSRGLGFAAAGTPDGEVAPSGDLRLVHGAPTPLTAIDVVAGGQLAVGSTPGVAHTFRVPSMEAVHDRRPPGLSRISGAVLSNAALLEADDGWRAVVLPSLGDIAADLGPGPVALRGDARRLAVAAAERVVEVALPEGAEEAEHEATVDALCFAGDALMAARGGAVGPLGSDATDGSAVVDLAGAASAPRAVALHEDGTVSVWSAEGERLAAWPAPLTDVSSIALSADGETVALGGAAAGDPVAALVRAADGAWERRVEGARGISPSPDGEGVAVCGDWGAVWLKTVEEDE